MHSNMANLNLGQDVAKKRERKQTAAHIVPYNKLQECVVTVLLLTSTPLVRITYSKFGTNKYFG